MEAIAIRFPSDSRLKTRQTSSFLRLLQESSVGDSEESVSSLDPSAFEQVPVRNEQTEKHQHLMRGKQEEIAQDHP